MKPSGSPGLRAGYGVPELLLGHSRHFLTKVIVMLSETLTMARLRVLSVQKKKKNGLGPGRDPKAVLFCTLAQYIHFLLVASLIDF